MFAVSPECQGQGLGRKLLDTFVKKAESRCVNFALSGVEGKPRVVVASIPYFSYFKVI